MVLKKQTIWLLTMLTLMVVLSAYYLYNPPVDNELVSEEGTEQMNAAETNMEDMDLTDLEGSEWLDEIGDLETDFSVTEADENPATDEGSITDESSTTDETLTMGGGFSDEMLAQQMEKEVQRAEQMEEYENMMNSSESTAQTIAEAKSEFDALHDLSAAEETLESLIAEEGYGEAVVVAGKENVNVLVNTEESLAREDAVEIIHLVREHLEVSGNQVYVSYQ